ncbi:MAG: SNF2-related protein [Candidatus Desantisbacteria bacterium]
MNAKRIGPLIDIDQRQYLLSLNQYKICEALDVFNSLPEEARTFKNNLLRFAEIKDFSELNSSILDKYLQNEFVCHPEKIIVDIKFNNGVLEIIPQPGKEVFNEITQKNEFKPSVEGFQGVFDRYSGVQDAYSTSNPKGQRTRVVFDDNQREQIERIKHRLRRISDPEKVKQISEDPLRFLDIDAEIIDISVFYSERVIEIGLYKPRFYPFVCPYKSEWIPGIGSEDRIHGKKNIFIKTKIELEEFKQEIERAKESGENSFDWKNTSIPIEEAEKVIEIAERQLANPKEPVKGTIALIIEENAEYLGYSEIGDEVDKEIEHIFFKINNLTPAISLKEHQQEGIAWLQNLYQENLRGCLLADDMGLGKTLQLLYFIEWHSQHFAHNNKPYLVVAPVSILENWENEYFRFFIPQSLPLIKLYGNTGLNREYDKKSVQKLQAKQLILTNYETIRAFQLNLCKVDYAVAVLDEAQKIKNPGTLITNASKALNADFKIAMTGTPVENTLVDMWCIMDFVKPGLLGNAKDFAKEFQHPLRKEETDIKEFGEKLRRKIGIFIKRRLKQDVAKDLPEKFDNEDSRVKRQMPIAQLERYKVEIEQAKNLELEGVERRNQILKSLWAIRDISDHPYLVDNKITDYSCEELISSSAKLQILIEILTDIKQKDEKAIVFADRKETQKMLQQVIFEYFKVLPRIINGDTPATQKGENKSKLSRQQTIDEFQNPNKKGFNVIVMSQLAAGVGLNVTGANHVIHYSRHWNPAKEEQATARTHRIGQTKDVYVYYPMAVSDEFKSFDLILDELLAKKKSLATATLFPTEQTEVKPEKIFNDVFGIDASVNATPYTFDQISKLTPANFEAFTAAIYNKLGYTTHLTPQSNDKGADVLAFRDKENFLIQSKQSSTPIDLKAVQEIVGAKGYYETTLHKKFQLIVFTNNVLNDNAKAYASCNSVNWLDRDKIVEYLTQYQITINDLYNCEKQRMKSV